ncbi:MAG: hypothetical protein RI907_1722 [Pseudomonadota bacterium]
MNAKRSLSLLLCQMALAWATCAQAASIARVLTDSPPAAGVRKVNTKVECPDSPVLPAALAGSLALAADETLDQAWRCTDVDGEHLLTVTRLQNPGQRGTQVLFTQRTRQGGTWKKDWQARDFFLSPVDNSPVRRNRVLLRDADGDGRIEAYIGYVLPGSSQTVDEGKLLVFSTGRKFAIRGAIPRGPDDFGSRQIGTAFHELPSPVQAQALDLWDQLSKTVSPAARAQRL